MRYWIAMTVLIATVAASFHVRAADCPADPRKASLVLWAGGSIPTGQTVSGTHPCGRKLTCTGGRPNAFMSRICHWE